MIKSFNNLFPKSEKGWILIDSLLGMIILSTAIVALLLTFTQSTKGSIASTTRTQATYLAQQALEKLKSQDGKSVKNIVMPATLPSPNPNYTITIDSPPVSAITNDSTLTNHLKPYRITVKLTDPSKQTQTEIVEIVGYGYE